jgi:hypothetical protein
VLGAALATVSPLAALAALRVLDHADDKTQAATPDDKTATAPGSGDATVNADEQACHERQPEVGVTVETRGSRGTGAQ